MSKKKGLYIALLILGIALVGLQVFVLKDIGNKQLSGICIGVGAGLFGMGAGQLISIMVIEKHPEAKRKVDIEAKDERNMYINDRARARAFNAMEIILPILALVLILMGEPLLTVLLVIGAYLTGWGTYIGYLGKYQKEM